MTNSVLDEAAVQEKFGVRPQQIIDLLALMGDNVDNIPGVEKCGPKTAAKWLSEYGTLDAVIAHADAIGGKVRSEEHTSELQSLMRISYAVFCLKKKKHMRQ